ncbi:MAG: hypothetical protein WDO13_01715 [Verrucomicrobiota bacterium]
MAPQTGGSRCRGLTSATPSFAASARRCACPRRIASTATSTTPRPRPPHTPTPGTGAFRVWLPPVGPTVEERIALFAQNAAALKADFRDAASPAEAARHLGEIAAAEGWQRVATHRHALAAPLAESLGLPRAAHRRGLSRRGAGALRRGHHRLRCAGGADRLGARLQRQRGRPRALRAAAAPRGHRVARAACGRPRRSAGRRAGALRAALAQHARFRHRPEPHRRHRAHPGPRRARAEETDDFSSSRSPHPL